jgi:hypothetical protein
MSIDDGLVASMLDTDTFKYDPLGRRIYKSSSPMGGWRRDSMNSEAIK